MMVFELLYLGMLLVRLALWFVRVLVMLHLAMIVVALPAGILVRTGMIVDVDAFAIVSCGWAAILLLLWWAARRRRRAQNARRGYGRPAAPARAV
jgi:hypothetical protein